MSQRAPETGGPVSRSADGKSQDSGQRDYDWGMPLDYWPDPEQDWAGEGFTRLNEESSS
jgi:hypothetical protein